MDQFLTPEEWNIDNLFKGKYIIPIYQRPYSWGENEVKQLLKDIYLSYQLFITSQSGDTSVKNEEMLLFTGTLFIKTNRNVKNEYTEYCRWSAKDYNINSYINDSFEHTYKN